jgi:hypothetical protein
MGRPIDPTSRNQVDQRAKRLRDPESRWRELLLETLALGCLKAQRWALYLEEGGDPGPLVGPFPKLPETLGEEVRIGVQQVEMPHNSPGFRYFLTWDVSGDDHEEMPPNPVSVDIVEAVVERLEIHVRNHLNPSFYREVAAWMGEQLVSEEPREEPAPIGPFHDLWTVPPTLVLPKDPPGVELVPSMEQFLHRAAAWHFSRVLYRKLLDPRPDALGRRGLERPALLRQLMEELEILKPGGLKTQPVGEKALARATTHEVPMLGFRAFPRPDKWDETEDGRGRFLHERRSSSGSRRWELTFQEGREDLAFASLARCQQVLEKGGLEITALHGLLCCLVMQQEDPGARFEVGGEALLEDLGYGQARGGRDGSTRSDLLRKVASAATLLGGVRCEGRSRNTSTGTKISMEFGPMWSIAVRADGQLKLLEEPGEEEVETVTDLTLTITPGTWVQSQRVLSSSGGSHLLYVPVASRVLSLGRYRQELAFRLGIHLAMGVRERKQWKGGRANVRVGQLLEEILPKGELDRAIQDRRAAYDLRHQWNTALATLHQVVGFRFEFPPGQYPPALIPEDLKPPEMADPGPAPHGALEQLLASRLEILWPEQVVEALLPKALPQKEREAPLQARTQKRAALQSRPNGARLREALEQAKASGVISGRREAADRLGMSVAQLSKLENGHKPLPERELQRCLNLLGTLRPGRS